MTTDSDARAEADEDAVEFRRAQQVKARQDQISPGQQSAL
jgi:hypothetical protein